MIIEFFHKVITDLGSKAVLININYNSFLDNIIIICDGVLKILISDPDTMAKGIPGEDLKEVVLTADEQLLSTRLMRVNHSGEVSAQALYQGQTLMAKTPLIKQAMEKASLEENDHLIWCKQRVYALGGHTSILNPLWYIGSFAIGVIAGKISDKWSLSFVAETERQVVKHLDEHIHQISPEDLKNLAVLEQMRIDELHHCAIALEAGGKILPKTVILMMRLMSQVMTKSSYWI